MIPKKQKREQTEATDLVNEVMKITLLRLASEIDRATADGIIESFFGFMRTITPYFDWIKLDTVKMQTLLAKNLQTYLIEYKSGTMPSIGGVAGLRGVALKDGETVYPCNSNGMIEYGEALKFAFEKLKYKDVANIRY